MQNLGREWRSFGDPNVVRKAMKAMENGDQTIQQKPLVFKHHSDVDFDAAKVM